LAGIEGERRRIGLARILVELRPGQAERILGLGLLQRGHHEAEARAFGILAHQLGAPLLAPARAVLAPAVARTVEAAQRQADFADRRARAHAALVRAEAAGPAREPERRLPRPILCIERS